METITIRVRDCACPGTPHTDGDEVYGLPKMPARGGIEAQVHLKEAADAAAMTGVWSIDCLRWGAVGWNLTDEQGRPVPFDVDVLIDDFELAEPVIDKLSDLYTPQVVHPLVRRSSGTSPSGATPSRGKVVSMSRTKRSTSKRPRRSSRPASEASMRSTA